MTATDEPQAAADARRVPVAPILVQDYRTLLRVFPYGYRREHEVEMLGDLLDGAGPGQSRPTRAERADLLRAAAREWLLAPLGPTARRRRVATGLLAVVLPALFVVPAARTLAYASALLGSEGGAPLAPSAPTAAMWIVWLAGALALIAGLVRTGRVLTVTAAAAGVATIAALVVTGAEHAAFLEVGWVVGLAAHAVVVVEQTRCRLPGYDWRRAVGTAACMAVALGGYVLAVIGETSTFEVPWWSGAGARGWPLGSVVVPLVGLLGVAALRSRTRQAVPVLLGVAVGVGLGRSELFWSGSRNPGTEDLGNVLALVACALAATIATRWAVDRLDELSEARATHRELLVAATTGTYSAQK